MQVKDKCNVFASDAGDGNHEWTCFCTVHWHASLRKFLEWVSFRFGTMPGTAGGDSLSGMGEYRYTTSVCYRPASLIFSCKVIYWFYRYRFYATVITSVCAAPYLSPRRLFRISKAVHDDALEYSLWRPSAVHFRANIALEFGFFSLGTKMQSESGL